ncbi:Smr/MutS family protein [Craterilacuibacter sp.]|uniref:Smr/MutS family protein n=1 Tax=Craterilacuibacter sp. TaxID=2870909 RepID=UPI003F3157AB
MKSYKAELKKLKQQVRPKALPVVRPAPAPPEEPDFALLFADIKPLKHAAYAPDTRPKPPHWPRSPSGRHQAGIQDLDAALLSEMTGWFERDEQPDQHLANGVPQSTLKKLRAGHWPIVATLDLHGTNRYEAHSLLALFLHRARAQGNCVRVVHGMGYGSRGAPVLPRMVRQWLAHHPHVLAFCTSRICDGGDGALLVLLKRSPLAFDD